MALLVISGANGFPTGFSRTSSRRQTTTSPSVLEMATQQQASEFELQLGRALDTLRNDYPDMLTTKPDYSIYDPDLVVVDPSGFTLHGITNYKQSFKVVHAIVNVFYCPEKSSLTFRLVYDAAHNHIRVSWNAQVVPKQFIQRNRPVRPLYVDGISVYELSSNGHIVQHRVEHLMINNRPVAPEQGIFSALLQQQGGDECIGTDCIPSFINKEDPAADVAQPALLSTVVEFQSMHPLLQQTSLLFDQEEQESTRLNGLSTSSTGGSSSNVDENYPGLDWDAYNRKNASRKKFGLDPLTPEEFLEIEQQVQQMASSATSSSAAEVPAKENKQSSSFLDTIFGEVVQDTCESNFDCQRPQVCCDFIFKKMCCSSGSMVGSNNANQQPVRIPVTKDDGYMNGW